jgi:anti-sigma factor RsiW
VKQASNLRAPGPEVRPRRLDDAVGYYYGELSPAERSRFEHHLRECEVCQRAVAAVLPADISVRPIDRRGN